jgi:hypothetical protein
MSDYPPEVYELLDLMASGKLKPKWTSSLHTSLVLQKGGGFKRMPIKDRKTADKLIEPAGRFERDMVRATLDPRLQDAFFMADHDKLISGRSITKLNKGGGQIQTVVAYSIDDKGKYELAKHQGAPQPEAEWSAPKAPKEWRRILGISETKMRRRIKDNKLVVDKQAKSLWCIRRDTLPPHLRTE